MKTCKDCLSYEACESLYRIAFKENINYAFTGTCKHFKNKADFMEVVRCKDCGMSRETEDERYLFCMQFADTVDSNAFCSYGERRDT